MPRKVIALGLAISLAGCANTGSQFAPMVDGQTSPMHRYEQDLRDCQAYAAQVGGAGTGAVVGAVGGALIGAALAAAAGSRYDWHATSRVGAVAGGLGGAGQGEQQQRNIIRNCMAGRGFKVLN